MPKKKKKRRRKIRKRVKKNKSQKRRRKIRKKVKKNKSQKKRKNKNKKKIKKQPSNELIFKVPKKWANKAYVNNIKYQKNINYRLKTMKVFGEKKEKELIG